MILTSKISLQPAKEVIVERKTPTKMFAKLLHVLTSGLSSPKEKQQTFTAISMLQDLNITLRQAGITNIVRLAKDGNDFYFDEHKKDNDLAEAMREFKVNTDAFSASLFEDLYLVLEHDDGQMRYLIEIDVKRVTKVDEMPINISISGVIKALEANAGENQQQLEQRLSKLFSNKQDLAKFSDRNRLIFDRFVHALEQQLRACIRCEELNVDSKAKVLRPAKDGESLRGNRRHGMAVHHDYPGWNNYALYSYCWLGMMVAVNAEAADLDVVNESGDVLQSFGEQGALSGAEAVFDMTQSEDKILSQQSSGYVGGVGGDGGNDSSSWLDFGGGDGGASCGSSCGGGCGA